MSLNKENEYKASSSENTELHPEFKKFDKPFGLEDHIFDSIFLGFICHACTFYYILYLWPFRVIPRSTIFYVVLMVYITGMGITVGVHRLWSHRTFKANLSLRIMLMLLQTATFQYPIFKWCWQHRVHHKYVDTNADPYSASRGFWFSHITWLFQRKHPDVEEKRKTIDISDLAGDPVVRFQSKYYWELVLVMFFFIPMGIFWWLYPEMSLFHIFSANCTRFVLTLHNTFLVNSVAHMWGNKPFDKSIS